MFTKDIQPNSFCILMHWNFHMTKLGESFSSLVCIGVILFKSHHFIYKRRFLLMLSSGCLTFKDTVA